MTQRRWFHLAVGVMAAVGALSPQAATAQGVAISGTNITIAGDDVLTFGDATPLYARGTGLENPANRLVKLGDTVLVDNGDRGLTLSIFDANGHVSSTNYDTWGLATDSDALATALATLASNQIGLLTSADAFEERITPALRSEAQRLGLVRLATQPNLSDPETWRHPYVAIFHGSPAPAPNRHAVEILQPNDADAPYAILATWLMDGGFVGQALPEPRPDPPCFSATQRFADCGNGTVTDSVTSLIYLKDASCSDLPGTDAEGRATYVDANAAAAALQDGICGLTDNSRPGDWRLQTKEEWEGILKLGCDDPFLVGNVAGSTLTSCYTDSGGAWASDVSLFAIYWWSTAWSPIGAWAATTFNGTISEGVKTSNGGTVWPVRGGQ